MNLQSKSVLLLTKPGLETCSKLPHDLTNLENFSSVKRIFLSELGIRRWSFWLQKGETQVLCLHCFEGEDKKNFHSVLKAFQKQLHDKNPYAVAIQQLFPDFTSGNHKVDKVLELDFYNPDEQPASLFPFCYALPLLPGRLEEHREYCRQAMHERKIETSQACKAFGMTHLSKWIQENNSEIFILYYQVSSLPSDACRQQFLSLSSDPKAQQATRALREQTGLKFNELCPPVDCVYVIK